ncbi:MAG: hypothetical protein QG666_341, partial [Euryarchaeota archaeon]|nr:hypothetical protein [Euryarchaeota archaeon]
DRQQIPRGMNFYISVNCLLNPVVQKVPRLDFVNIRFSKSRRSISVAS